MNNEILVGGNHLANYLLGKLGGGFADKFPPTMNHDKVRETLFDLLNRNHDLFNDIYDVWCCWSAIMRVRGWPTPID